MYYVDSSGELRLEIRRLFRRAARQGRGTEFVDALRAINARLEIDPLTFGEALYDMKLARWAVRMGVICPVSVIYMVSADLPTVILGQIRLMSRG